MQVLTTSILFLISLFMAETTAFLGPDIYYESSAKSRPRSLPSGRENYFRDLTARLERQMRKLQSPDVEVPQKSNGATEKPVNAVQLDRKTQIQQKVPDEVGFHVTLYRKTYVGENNPILPFDTVREAMPQGAYDKETGLFTCPVAGTYLVSLTIANSEDNVIYANVLLNKYDRKISVVSYGGSQISQGSATGIIKLRAGDTLSVGIDRPTHAHVHGNHLSSWSVYLLKKD